VKTAALIVPLALRAFPPEGSERLRSGHASLLAPQGVRRIEGARG